MEGDVRSLHQAGSILDPPMAIPATCGASAAFQLLDAAANRYSLSRDRNGVFGTSVQIGGRRGKASGEPKARSITIAVARALGLEF